MHLYVVRHAKAHARDPERWPDDSERPLTEEGEEEFRVVARALARVQPRVDLVFSSPYARAWRTAELLVEEAGWPAPNPLATLEPTLPPEKTAGELRQIHAAGGAGSVAIVGHRPCLHELSSYLITGSADGAEIVIKKGGVLCIRFDGAPEPGAGGIAWSVSPKLVRLLTG